MGNVLASDSIEPYFPSTLSGDVATPLSQTHRAPKVYRIKTALKTPLDRGSLSGRVAHAVLSNELGAHGFGLDIDVSNESGILPALNEMLAQIDDANFHVEVRRVGKTPEDVQKCISSGRALAVALPVTQDVLDGNFDMPQNEDDHFALVPAVVWAYTSHQQKYICNVGLTQYEGEPLTISEEHLFAPESCDFFTIVLTPAEAPLFLRDDEEGGE